MKKLSIITALTLCLALTGCTDDTQSGNVDFTTNSAAITTTQSETSYRFEPMFDDIWEEPSETFSETEYVLETTTEHIETTQEETTSENSGIYVYYTNTGKKYHYDNHCNDGTYYECLLETALSMGLEPCKKCAGG